MMRTFNYFGSYIKLYLEGFIFNVDNFVRPGDLVQFKLRRNKKRTGNRKMKKIYD